MGEAFCTLKQKWGAIVSQTRANYEGALGAVLGAFCGDAAGGPLEFQGEPKSAAVTAAMEMRGGGVAGLGSGQITDDSELALSLANGLAEGGSTLNLDRIVKYYGMWMESPPFGMLFMLDHRSWQYYQGRIMLH